METATLSNLRPQSVTPCYHRHRFAQICTNECCVQCAYVGFIYIKGDMQHKGSTDRSRNLTLSVFSLHVAAFGKAISRQLKIYMQKENLSRTNQSDTFSGS